SKSFLKISTSSLYWPIHNSLLGNQNLNEKVPNHQHRGIVKIPTGAVCRKGLYCSRNFRPSAEFPASRQRLGHALPFGGLRVIRGSKQGKTPRHSNSSQNASMPAAS